MLEAKNIVKVYGGRRVVDEVNLQVKKGEVVGLLGPNGAGKTTTFYCLVGFISPLTGQVILDSKEITRLPMYKRARKGIGYLAQEPSIFRKLTVKENVLAILQTLKLSETERQEKSRALLQELKIEHLADQPAYTLSGGERRRTEIARAMVTSPNFILLDEPFVGIDPIAVSDIQQIIRRLKEKGLGVLITDHSVRETLEITDRAYIMYQGKILIHGTASELVNDPKAREIYLGERFRMD
ncbi:MAG: LPS export ABC transporter ATP-binding protein [bacterium]|nr:LPS export ABC transporter ATP-binding protein [bacterium]